MIVNFIAREINRGTRKLFRTPTLLKKKKKHLHCSFIGYRIQWSRRIRYRCLLWPDRHFLDKTLQEGPLLDKAWDHEL